jgi:hypothetical protein
MYALRLTVALNRRKTKRDTRRGSSNSDSSSSVSATIVVTDDADIHLNPDYNNDDNNIFFYAATVNAFDHRSTVREYFHNSRSRINPNNKSLWPLRYRAYEDCVI